MPGTRSVLEQRLHAHVAHRERSRANDLGQEGFRTRVAIEHAVFAAFFVVQHELQGQSRALWPGGMWRIASVAAQVARVA